MGYNFELLRELLDTVHFIFNKHVGPHRLYIDITIHQHNIIILVISMDNLCRPTCVSNKTNNLLITAFGNTAVQSQKAISAYFTSKQILPFGFAEQYPDAHLPD